MNSIKKISIGAASFLAILYFCKKLLYALFPIMILSKYIVVLVVGAVIGAALYHILEKRA